MLMSDGGMEVESTNAHVGWRHYHLLFKTLNLDTLSVFSYAARYSALNCIEHLWSPLSNQLLGV